MRGTASLMGGLALVGLSALACRSGGGGAERLGEASAAATLIPAAQASATTLAPPLEGGPRPFPSQRTNYREDPDFQLPSPQELPPAPEGEAGLEFHPPPDPVCPPAWEQLYRPAEGFKICYPDGWRIDGYGYVTVPVDDRWFSLGIFRFREDGRESAHVSVYLTGPFSQPFTYVRDCQQAYRVTLAGSAASLCPDHEGVFPEAKIIAYHIRKGDRDYFINVAPQFTYDATRGGYLTTWSREDEETAIQIAHSFQFLEEAPARGQAPPPPAPLEGETPGAP